MTDDKSEGWEDVAAEFMAVRSDIGAALVRDWARDHVPANAAILDIGCGSGAPIAQALVDQGFDVFGIDPSPAMIAAFRRRFPTAKAACEAVQDSPFFHRQFDGVIAIGVIFLLSRDDQARVINSLAKALKPKGHLLFSAAHQKWEWKDTLTGRTSRSLGHEAYTSLLEEAGLPLVERLTDEGDNHYFHAIRN